MDAMKIKGSWLRRYTANGLRSSIKLLRRNDPICTCTEHEELASEKHLDAANKVIWCLVLAAVLFIGGCITSRPAHAEQIDMHKIMMIESGGRNIPSDMNTEHAIGIYQITPVVLGDWNRHNDIKYTNQDLWNMAINTKVAEWYLTKRIPQMLKHYKKPATVRNILIAYNAGISYVVSGKPLPKITVRYLKKYGVA